MIIIIISLQFLFYQYLILVTIDNNEKIFDTYFSLLFIIIFFNYL